MQMAAQVKFSINLLLQLIEMCYTKVLQNLASHVPKIYQYKQALLSCDRLIMNYIFIVQQMLNKSFT